MGTIMPDMIPDLWPADVVTTVVTPLAIMRFQAGQLRQRTGNLLQGDIQTEADFDKGWTQHHFELVAPALDHYRYRLFTARHRADLVYPVVVESACIEGEGEGEARFPVVTQALQSALKRTGPPEAATQQEFIELVGNIFRSKKARSVIHSLIARSNDLGGEQQPS